MHNNNKNYVINTYCYYFRKSLQSKEDTPIVSASAHLREHQLEEERGKKHFTSPENPAAHSTDCVSVSGCSDDGWG